jgi:hypothetical protein
MLYKKCLLGLYNSIKTVEFLSSIFLIATLNHIVLVKVYSFSLSK